MESNITQKLQNTLKEQAQKFEADSKIKEYEDAIIFFEKLVEEGLVKRRGYNLMTIDKAHLTGHTFNVRT